MANVVTLQITINSQGAVTGAKAVNQALAGVQSQAKQTSAAVNNLNGSFKSLQQSMFSLRGAITGIGLGFLIKELINTNVAFNQIETTLFAASDNVKLVASDFQFVRQEALRLGADVTQVGTEFARLAAAAKGTSLEGQTIKDVFSATVEAFVATGQSAEQARLGIFALQQMISKGRVQAEELRGQFGERLPGAFAAAARALGVTTPQLNKMLELGQVTAEQLLPKLAQELRNTFGRAFEEAVKRPRFAIGQFQATLREFMYSISNMGFMDNFVNATRELTKVLNGPDGQKLAAFIGTVLDATATAAAKAVILLANNIDILTAALTGLAASRVIATLGQLLPLVRSIGAAFLAVGGVATGVFGLIAAAIGGAVAAVFYFRDSIVEMEGSVAAVRDYVTVAWRYISEQISSLANLIGSQLSNAWQEFLEKWDSALPKIQKFGETVVTWLDFAIAGFRMFGVVIAEYSQFLWTSFTKVIDDLKQRFVSFFEGLSAANKGDFKGAGLHFARTFSEGLDLGFADMQKRIDAKFQDIAGDQPIRKALDDLGQKTKGILGAWGQAAGEEYENRMEIQRRLGQLGASAANELKKLEDQRNALAQSRKGSGDELSEKEQKEINKIREKVEALFLEQTQYQRLTDAMQVSAEATAEVERAIYIENALRSAGLQLIEKEGTERGMLATIVRDQAGAIWDLKQKEDALKESQRAQKQAIEEIGKAYLQTMPAGQRMAQEALEWRSKQLDAIKDVKDGYDELAAQIEAVYNSRLKAAQEKALEDSTHWADGVKRAAKSMIDEIEDDASRIEDGLTKAFKSAEDAFVEFVTTGKISFGDFVNSIIADLARAVFQKSVTAPLMGFLGSLFHTGGVVGETNVPQRHVSLGNQSTIPKFHGGGGYLKSDEMMAILRRGEIVLTPEQMKAAGKSGGGGGGVIVNVINNASGTETSTNESQNSDGSRLIEVIVDQRVATSMSSRGSPVNKSLRNNFGATETLIKR